jgi:hypothetical protein
MRVTGDAKLVERIAARPEVASIEPERVHRLPETGAADAAAVTAAVEWGVASIHAPLASCGGSCVLSGPTVGEPLRWLSVKSGCTHAGRIDDMLVVAVRCLSLDAATTSPP